MTYDRAGGFVALRSLPMSAGTKPVEQGRGQSRSAARVGLHFEILSSTAELLNVQTHWRELHARCGRDPFGDIDLVLAWWRTTGEANRRMRLHVVAGWRDQQLVAVLPLVVVRQRGIRIMRGVGNNSERFCDLICNDEATAEAAWRFAQNSHGYDFAICRGVYAGSLSHAILPRLARQRDTLTEYYSKSTWPDGNGWVASLSHRPRSEVARSVRRLEKQGPVRFHVHPAGPPDAEIVRNMIEMKRSWVADNNLDSWITEPSAVTYFQQMSEAAAASNRLFIAWLTCGDEKIAFHQGYTYNGMLYLELMTYHAEWSSFSLGNITMMHVIRWAFDHGMTAVNHGPSMDDPRSKGQALFKAKYSNETISGGEFTFSRTWRGRVMEGTWVYARELWRRHQARRHQRRAKISRQVRPAGPDIPKP